jgi:hypothetical protein
MMYSRLHCFVLTCLPATCNRVVLYCTCTELYCTPCMPTCTVLALLFCTAGVVYTIPASTWLRDKLPNPFPPICEGPEAISHR